MKRIRILVAFSGFFISGASLAQGDREPNNLPNSATDFSNGVGEVRGSIRYRTDVGDYFLIGKAIHHAVRVRATLDAVGEHVDDDLGLNLDWEKRVFVDGKSVYHPPRVNGPPSDSPQEFIDFLVPKGAGKIYLLVHGNLGDIPYGAPVWPPYAWDGLSEYVLTFQTKPVDTQKPAIKFLGGDKLRSRKPSIKVRASDDVGVRRIRIRALGREKSVFADGRRHFQAGMKLPDPKGRRLPRRIRVWVTATDTAGKTVYGSRIYRS